MNAAGLTPVHVDPYEFCDLDDHLHVASLVDFVERFGARA